MIKNMHERIKWYKKEFIHDRYSRIVEDFKDYEKITAVKMLDAVYKVYQDYNNIINICTVRELKYLKMILDEKVSNNDLLSNKFEWERKTLHNKFLVEIDYSDVVFIPEEIIDKVKDAVKNVNWTTSKKLDDINEILVSYCKIQASALLVSVCSFGSAITGISEDDLMTHMLHNKLFNYYVMVYPKDFPEFNKSIYVALYQDYYSIEEQIDEERRRQGLSGALKIDLNKYRTLFYNDFDINNKKVKKFLIEIKKLPFFWNKALDMVREFAVLNIDREPLKDAISSVPSLESYDLTDFFKILDAAMDEMPSGALNGLTPNEAKKIESEEIINKLLKEKNFVKQHNASLSKEDAKLFYKIYFGLLEFTNNKYKIKPGIKLYNKNGINPSEIQDIVETFWTNKENMVSEFCLNNPYNFNEEELEIAREFKKGFRDLFIIVKFYEEYTAIMNKDKVYMIKGINDNIDNIISYKDLPKPTIMSILPFKNVLIYDSMFFTFNIKVGSGIDKKIIEDFEESIKYYHL